MIESRDGQGLVSKARGRGGVKLIALVPCDYHFQALGYKRHHSKIGLWNSRNTFFANHSVRGTLWKICKKVTNHFPVGATKLVGFSAGKREGEEAIWRRFEHFEHFESNRRYRSQP